MTFETKKKMEKKDILLFVHDIRKFDSTMNGNFESLNDSLLNESRRLANNMKQF